MKKFTRILSLIVLLGIFLSFSGCSSYLDELRAARASVTEDGVIVLADGVKYLLLPENEYFCYDHANDTPIYVMEDEEVPLLLIVSYGDTGFKTQDGQFLRVYSSGKNQYYCREDSYDSILACMNEGFTPELYCYYYHDYETYEQVLYTLTPQQAEAIEDVLANQEPYTLPAGAKLDYDYRVHLYHYSSDYLFREDSVDICFADGSFYVVDDELIYQVPNNLYVLFARAVKKYLD